MQKKVNYHSHSLHSDGKDSVERLVNHYHHCGVTHFALTDHDTLDGVTQAQELASKLGMKCYTGIEMTACIDFEKSEYCHILGFDFDLEKMNTILDDYYCGSSGFDVYSVSHIEPKKAVETIHKAGGIAILAHPFDIICFAKCSIEKQRAHKLIKDMIDCKIDGIEVFYRNFSKEQIMQLDKWADEYKLIKSIGSDYHGHSHDGAYFDSHIDLLEGKNTIHEVLLDRHKI